MPVTKGILGCTASWLAPDNLSRRDVNSVDNFNRFERPPVYIVTALTNVAMLLSLKHYTSNALVLDTYWRYV